MPNYLYTHHETGATREINRPVAERNDNLPDDPLGLWKRDIEAPGVVYAFKQQPTQAEKTMAGYHRLECEEGSRFRSGFSKDHIKKTWQRSRQAEQAGLIK